MNGFIWAGLVAAWLAMAANAPQRSFGGYPQSDSGKVRVTIKLLVYPDVGSAYETLVSLTAM